MMRYREKKRPEPVTGFLLLAAFLLFTLLVKIVDVKPIGPQGSRVGFAALNQAMASLMNREKRALRRKKSPRKKKNLRKRI